MISHLSILGADPGLVLRGPAQVRQELFARPVVGAVLVSRDSVAPGNTSHVTYCHITSHDT